MAGLIAVLNMSTSRAGVAVAIAGPEQVIFDSPSQGCGPDDFVDEPFRIVRTSTGVLATAGAYSNYFFRGNSIYKFGRDCSSNFSAGLDERPEAFDYKAWLMTLWTADGVNIHALAHEEFVGGQIPGRCINPGTYECNYKAIIPYVSHDSGKTFERASTVPVAAPQQVQSPAISQMLGYEIISNIVKRGPYHYFLVNMVPDVGQTGHICIFRTLDPAQPGEWKYRSNANWVDPHYSAYSGMAAPPDCTPVSGLHGIPWSLLRRRGTNEYIALTTSGSKTPNRIDVLVATSSDLINWSAPSVVMTLPASWNAGCDLPYKYNYFSLVDKGSGRNFEVIDSSATLYMARIKTDGCRLTKERDLIAVPVTINYN